MSLDSDLTAGFQVKYLGSICFTRKKRKPLKGIVSLQRPLLDLYTEARRRGTNRGETVITKVITPLSNVILWAAVRFHARIIKKRVFGAAFVPLACSDGVLDHKSYICLASKQRFLVSLTHPSVFACIYRSVSSPTTFECHAFVCATAEDALAVAGLATLASQQNDLPSVRRSLYLDHQPRRRIAASVDSGTDYYTPSDVTPAPREEEDRGYGPPFRENVIIRTDTEEESNSYASVIKAASPNMGRRRFGMGARSQYRTQPRKRFMNHREARALIGRCGVPGRPLPEDEELWRASLPPHVRNPDLLEEQQRLTPAYDQRVWALNSFGQTYLIRCHQRGNGTGKVTINVSYNNLRPESRNSSASSRTVPHGVRGNGPHFRPLSQFQKGQQHHPQKVIRWSSEDRLPRRQSGGFFLSLKRLSIQSLTKAKHKTGKFISSMKTRLMGTKRSSADGSEDSAYDTSEVCLSPSVAKAPPRPHTPTRPEECRSRKHRRRSRKAGQSSSSSDSGVEAAYHSDNSGRKSDPGRLTNDLNYNLSSRFISSMKTRLMGTKRSSADGSEDSAYDTSEVCLSPSGRQGSSSPSRQPAQRNAARRQQSWSFHDLRSAAVEKPVVRRNHNVHHRRKHRRRSRKAGQSSSSSDSGVEAAYHSDNSGRKSDPGRLTNGSGVTRVQVQHGMGTGTFQRWSNTNIQDELGYIP
ncbi:hypothetical protein HNY73_014055 [Argiope bruennichi]|uniref:PID domain-containing protein n=1 Tax=Argiope bruennichi TaxID=94029 RepID=A0A8T0ERR9_ARGBR|nr:hypothetical protein HNY73_014055 [Argiope bruennichi]